MHTSLLSTSFMFVSFPSASDSVGGKHGRSEMLLSYGPHKLAMVGLETIYF